jgi:peptidoglycan/LPS O-acetylase OafA/YrhL
VFFYLGFGLLIVGGRWMVLILPVWVVAIVGYGTMEKIASFPTTFFLNPYNLEFITGMAVAVILRRTTVPFPGLILALGVCIFFGAVFLRVGTIIGPTTLAVRTIFAAGAGLSVLGIVEIDRSGHFSYPKWLVLFGTASYSIYLIHVVVEAAAAKLLRPFGGRVSPDLLVILITALGIASGILFHLTIERKVISRVNAWLFSEFNEQTLMPDATVPVSELVVEEKGI